MMTETTVDPDKINLEPNWKKRLLPEFSKAYLLELREFLRKEKANGRIVYPASADIFAAFRETPFEKVRVVILGQDPYHGPGQAHGLSFSVPTGVPAPPSLVNIFKELQTDVDGFVKPKHGNLLSWARQGVLLLNSVLTVEAGKAGSHQNRGWEIFTDRVIELLSTEREHLVFILWGSYAQKKGAKIDRNKHLVIESVHPSPLSSYRGFFGSKPFSQAAQYLKASDGYDLNFKID